MKKLELKNDVDNLLKFSNLKNDNTKAYNYLKNIPEIFFNDIKINNLILALNEENDKLTELKSYPYIIVIEPTNNCNLKCPLCSTGLDSNSRLKGKLSIENYKKVIDSCKDYLLQLYLQNWGEPTLINYLPEMIKYAANQGIWTHVSTNLSINYKKDFLERLVKSGLAVLLVDVDGTTQEVYEKYRVKGKLNTVVNNIKTIVKLKKIYKVEYPIIEASMLVTSKNEHQIDEFKELVEDLGVDRYSFGNIQVNPNTSMNWLPKNKDYVYPTYSGKNYKITACHWPWSGFVINWDGGVSPCCIVDDQKADFGNILHDNLMNVWNSKYFKSARSEFSDKKDIKINTICNICKNDTHNIKLKRFKDSFSLTL